MCIFFCTSATLSVHFVHFGEVVKGISTVLGCYGSAALGAVTTLPLLRQSTVRCLTRGSQCLHFYSRRRVLLLHQGQTRRFEPLPLPCPSALSMQAVSHRFALKCKGGNSDDGHGVMLVLHCGRQVAFSKSIPSYSRDCSPKDKDRSSSKLARVSKFALQTVHHSFVRVLEVSTEMHPIFFNLHR